MNLKNIIQLKIKEFTDTENTLEFLYLLSDIKKVIRLYLPEHDLQGVLMLCTKENIKAVIAPYKMTTEPDKNKGGISSGGRLVSLSNKGSIILFCSKERTLAELACKAELQQDHHKLGKLLGYPECCIKEYQKNLGESFNKQGDLTEFILKKEKGFKKPYQCNYFPIYFGIPIIPHYPCSLSCNETIQFVNSTLKIKELDKSKHQIISLMKSIVIYTEYEGIFIIPEYIQKDNHFIYDPAKIIATADTDMLKELKKRDTINIKDNQDAEFRSSKEKHPIFNLNKDSWIFVFQ